MACFIGSSLHVATWTGLDLHLDLTVARGPEHAALDAVLRNLCGLRRNPLQQPISPVPLMMGLNACLQLTGQYQFTIAQGWDAASFLSCLLGELAVAPGFLVETLEEGICQQCGNASRQVTGDSPYLVLFTPSLYIDLYCTVVCKSDCGKS